MPELKFDPFPVLETERLMLRKISIDDAEDMFHLRTNEDAMKYINKPKLLSIDDAKEIINKMNDSERIQWGIALKNENKIIGTIGYHRIEKEHYRAEIGYMLDPDYWSTKMKLHSIEAIINPGNTISRKILQKFNFIKEAYFKESYFFEGRFLDSEVYSLVKG
jgi:[ribosomal protein S5]-alanine N-acetyltransferase